MPGGYQYLKKKSLEQYQLKKEEDPLKYRYGITLEQRDKMLDEQGGLCAICSEELSVKVKAKNKACVDHCHESNTIRGILCYQCNVGLGSFKDNIELFERAIKYLEEKETAYDF